ncbi:MAG: SufE family protein [Pseudomonadota bacterium]
MSYPLTTDTDIEEIIENFEMLDDWEDRYSYLIELGKALKPLDESEMVDDNKVNGCVSQVWLVSEPEGPKYNFRGGSDAHIVRGLVAIALTLFSDKTREEIATIDAEDTFRQIGLQEHITPQRANGLRAMVERIREESQIAA